MHDSFLNHKEPDEVFLSLSNRQYAEFYSLEMDDFTADIAFYQKLCGPDSSILELGCGTGRIARHFASAGQFVVGLDCSCSMLKNTPDNSADFPHYICMDMTRIGLLQKFDRILIPYNTLNLLNNRQLITTCLEQSRELLRPDGSLILQLYVPDIQIIKPAGKKLFQFQVFQLKNKSGRLIKETIRSFLPEKEEIHLEERYRVRPGNDRKERQDYKHHLYLAGYSSEQWINLLKMAGFHKLILYGDYNCRPFQGLQDSLLLVEASPS